MTFDYGSIRNITAYHGVNIIPLETMGIQGSYDAQSYLCTLNQVEMISQLEKMPTYIFYFILACFIAFMLHFHLEPHLKKYKWFSYIGENNFLGLAYVMMGTALTLSFFWTFKIDESKQYIIKIILAVWFVIFLILLIRKLYQNYFKVRLNPYGVDLSNPDFSKIDFKKLIDDLNMVKDDLDKEDAESEENDKKKL